MAAARFSPLLCPDFDKILAIFSSLHIYEDSVKIWKEKESAMDLSLELYLSAFGLYDE